ncbi:MULTISPECIES: carbamoyltransferase [unclassified Bradyrhizobium]|uniref:carbamoyltransferase family protein n=1 Tax=unclassified Bradyrhizobium TaxID=2631580 RepID=UPI0029170CAC|nr:MULTISPECIES: carbamoyltransferase N-terminal domain-containing protein [unclassified Bradyrhizobium]
MGISAFFHDSSAALIVEGKLVAAAAEERFTRLKHDSNFPTRAIAFCLEQGDLSAHELDAVVFYEEPHTKFTRVLVSILASFPHSAGAFVGAAKGWLKKYLWTLNAISRELDIDPRKVRMIPHHLSHAAQSFAPSPFERAAILTLDAVGEWVCTAISVGDRSSPVPLRTCETQSYPHSLGLLYAAFTGFLGFRPNDAEASTMALAAFGTPRFRDELQSVISLDEEGRYAIDPYMFDFLQPDLRVLTPQFRKMFGEPRPFGQPWPFDAMADADQEVSAEDQKYADIAASLQEATEDALLKLARRAQRLTGARKLCLAGGVALNACAVGRIIRESGFEDVFVPPDPGDGGAAIGAAWVEHARLCGRADSVAISPYLGLADPTEPGADFVGQLDLSEWVPGVAGASGMPVRIETHSYKDMHQLAERVAEDLLAGRIVGWCQGRFELGPRALGARSILADPSDLGTAHRLSREVKRRQSFRPYALSVREEDASRLFEDARPDSYPARWMLMVEPVRKDVLPLVRAGVHRDGTTRPQICTRDDNPGFHALLNAIARKRGLGALLNTSLNEPGYPIAATGQEALLIFARTSMDTIAINNIVIRKV